MGARGQPKLDPSNNRPTWGRCDIGTGFIVASQMTQTNPSTPQLQGVPNEVGLLQRVNSPHQCAGGASRWNRRQALLSYCVLSPCLATRAPPTCRSTTETIRKASFCAAAAAAAAGDHNEELFIFAFISMRVFLGVFFLPSFYPKYPSAGPYGRDFRRAGLL